LHSLVRGVYRVGHDPSEAGDKDPWMVTLPGRYGEIYPFGKDRLAVEVEDPRIAARVAAIRGAIPYQRGEWHWSFTFHVSYLGAVAAVIHPRKIRPLSASAQKRLEALGGKAVTSKNPSVLNPVSVAALPDKTQWDDPDAHCEPLVGQCSTSLEEKTACHR